MQCTSRDVAVFLYIHLLFIILHVRFSTEIPDVSAHNIIRRSNIISIFYYVVGHNTKIRTKERAPCIHCSDRDVISFFETTKCVLYSRVKNIFIFIVRYNILVQDIVTLCICVCMYIYM